MAANSPLLRPLGIAAGGLGCFQAITWGVLSVLGILVYTDVISWTPSETASNEFQNALVSMYFTTTKYNNGGNHSDLNTTTQLTYEVPGIMDPGTVVIWTSLYLATSVIWLVISGFLLHDFYTSKFTSKLIIGWVAVSAVVAAIDLAGTVVFGIDYNTVQSSDKPPTEELLAPIFMMTMCARGFILWIMNVGLVIYLGVAASKLNKKEPAKLLRQPSITSQYSIMRASLYSTPKVDSSSNERQNPAFQPDPIYGWDIQSPTVGSQQRSPWNFSENNSPRLNDVVNPIKPLPRVAKPVATPVAPLPIPHPDYSPILGRPVKHEPNLYDIPMRSALKKPNSLGHTIF